mmetsp:Transcript_742/g.1467  ORF Transcript_742/g.1467 Transcript_742/m.1467 type:complete len:87 (+) Transcript_742:101-361(+)
MILHMLYRRRRRRREARLGRIGDGASEFRREEMVDDDDDDDDDDARDVPSKISSIMVRLPAVCTDAKGRDRFKTLELAIVSWWIVL